MMQYMEKSEITLVRLYHEIQKKSNSPGYGVSVNCPDCGGFAIGIVGFNGNVRFNCMHCKKEIQWDKGGEML